MKFEIVHRIGANADWKNHPLSSTQIEFLIIHYSGGNWFRIKEIFEKSKDFNGVSCHFAIDENGVVDEIIPTLGSLTYKGAHCGESYWIDDQHHFWNAFNNFSIGIELINPNGNLLDFTSAQYFSLFKLVALLKEKYPKLRNFSRVLGHEHIAGFRGKVDPGLRFDWTLFFQSCFDTPSPIQCKTSSLVLDCYREFFHPGFERQIKDSNIKFWHDLNFSMEKATALVHNGVNELRIKKWITDFVNSMKDVQ
jgi:N-acetylmuramoyl-L-alanine amidase